MGPRPNYDGKPRTPRLSLLIYKVKKNDSWSIRTPRSHLEKEYQKDTEALKNRFGSHLITVLPEQRKRYMIPCYAKPHAADR